MKTVSIDFKGVIYDDGGDANCIIDMSKPPVKGIKEAIDKIKKAGYDIVIATDWNSSGGINQASIIKEYLSKYNINATNVSAFNVFFSDIHIGSRSICFDGYPETLLDKIYNYRPWNYTDSFNEAKIFGVNVLFTGERISRFKYSSFGLYRYEVGCDELNNPICFQTDLSTFLNDNFYGTILSKSDLINFKSDRFYASNGNYGIKINRDDLLVTDKFVTIREYINNGGN